MSSLTRSLRPAALVAAVLILPCCRDQIGQGDKLKAVTVRASLNFSKIEPLADCVEAAISPNGRWVVFSSTSSNITPNDNNGLRDLFLRDRLTGVIVNITNVLLFGEFPQYYPQDCFDPQVSDDGNFIVFRSKGGWYAYTAPASPLPFYAIFRYDRKLDKFERAYVDTGSPPDGDMFNPCLSADGQIVAYTSNATNLVPANGSGFTQIVAHNFGSGTSTIVSRSTAGVNVPCDASCNNPRISPDGGYIVFQSDSTNLDAATAGAVMPQVYRGTYTGAPVLALGRDSGGVLTSAQTFLPDVSEDGRFVVFHTYDQNLVSPPATSSPILVRRSIIDGTTELVTDKPGLIPFLVFPNGYPASISGDGQTVAFLGRDDSLAGGTPLNFKAQVFVRDMSSSNILFCSQHLDGTPSNIDCSPPRMSADGKWVVWSTQGSTLVDGDTNGKSDVFLRGPLR